MDGLYRRSTNVGTKLNKRVYLSRADNGEADASVAARRLDDGLPRLQVAVSLSPLDTAKSKAVLELELDWREVVGGQPGGVDGGTCMAYLDRATRIHALCFDENVHALGCHALQLDHRRLMWCGAVCRKSGVAWCDAVQRGAAWSLVPSYLSNRAHHARMHAAPCHGGYRAGPSRCGGGPQHHHRKGRERKLS